MVKYSLIEIITMLIKMAVLNAKLLNVNTITGEVVFFKDTKVIKEFYGNEEKKGKKKVKSR